MTRDDAIARLRAHEAELKELGVEHLYLFGSTARGEARDDSDVDLFFDHPEGAIGLYELMDVRERRPSAFSNTRRTLSPAGACIGFCGGGSRRRRCKCSECHVRQSPR
jgi:predicted nucleotidyltransferase